MSLLQSLLGGNQAQMPGAMSQPSGLSRLLQPEVGLPMAAALLGNQGNMANLGNAFGAGGQALQAQKAQMAEQAQQNKTYEFFKQNAPEFAQLIEGGAPVDQVWKQYTEQRFAQAKDPYKVVGGQVFNTQDQSWIQPPGSGDPEFRMAAPEEAARYGAQAGQFGPDGRFYPLNPPQGMTIESDGEGGFRMVQGPGAGTKFTEAQSKDNVYSTRARGAMPTLDQYEQNLTSLGNRALDSDPTGIVRGSLQGADYQVAQAAGQEFLQAILRKDTGAAITEPEQALYGRTYLPQPGDGPEVIAYKKQARARAVAAIEAGMTPAQMVAQERALQASGGNAPPQAGGSQRYRFNPATGELE